MRNLRLFSTTAEADDAYANDYEEPWVSYTDENEEVRYNKSAYDTPLTFEAISAGTITWVSQSTGGNKTIEYKRNDGEWAEITSSTAGTPITVAAGDRVQFRGDNAAYYSKIYTGPGARFGQSGSTLRVKIEGNIMSMIDSTGYASLKTLTEPGAFGYIFGMVGVTEASGLLLPATALTEYCYTLMFDGCHYLTSAPELPATVLARECYMDMFRECLALRQGPDLPAPVLAASCYYGMFWNSGVKSVKCLATDISAADCTTYWLNSAPSTGTFTKAASMNDWPRSTDGIPAGWTVVDA